MEQPESSHTCASSPFTMRAPNTLPHPDSQLSRLTRGSIPFVSPMISTSSSLPSLSVTIVASGLVAVGVSLLVLLWLPPPLLRTMLLAPPPLLLLLPLPVLPPLWLLLLLLLLLLFPVAPWALLMWVVALALAMAAVVVLVTTLELLVLLLLTPDCRLAAMPAAMLSVRDCSVSASAIALWRTSGSVASKPLFSANARMFWRDESTIALAASTARAGLRMNESGSSVTIGVSVRTLLERIVRRLPTIVR